MSEQQSILSHYQNLLDQQPNSIEWLNELQQNAFKQLQQTGLPTHKLEDWKYTKTTKLLNQTFDVNTQATKLTADQLKKTSQFSQLDAHRLVFINGIFNSDLSQLDQLPADIVVCDLATALTQHEKALNAFLAKNDHQHKPSQHGFSNLNMALMQYGAYIQVPEHCVVEKPIVLIFISTVEANQCVLPIRNMIDIAENAKVCVLEEYTHLSDSNYFTNVITDCQLADNAILDHYKVIQESNQAFHVGTVLSSQQTHSQFHSYSLTTSGQLVRSDTQALLQGKKSHCKLHGLFIGKQQQHIDHHTYIEHKVPNTTSDELYKGILTDKAKGVFNGRVFVNEGATGTDAQQQNHNLLLSQHAEIDTKPQLEIYNDDVTCSHGATVGQLNQSSLFYLQTRGIAETEAHHLLTLAFASDALNTAGNKAILAHLMACIDTALLTFNHR